MEEKGFLVNGDIVVVDNYYFEIDRDKLEIVKAKGKYESDVLISYSVYDNQDSENIKIRVRFYNENGIKSIEKPDGTVVDGEGKKEVYIDYVVNANTDENFKVILDSNVEVISNLKITEKGINETFKISNYEVDGETEENEFCNIKVNYDNKESTDKTYYKIGESGQWYEYTDNIQLDMAAIENVTNEAGTEGKTIVYIKKEDANGNIVTIPKEVEIKSTAYSVFSNIRYKGESSDKYFTSVKGSSQFDPSYIGDNYLLFDFGYGHGSGSGNYSATYNLNYSKLELKTANKLKVIFNHYIETSDQVSTYAKVYYTDGSSSEEKVSEFEFYERWTIFGYTESRSSVTIDLEENKTVDYIELKINGYDSRGGSFYGMIRDIILFGASK